MLSKKIDREAGQGLSQETARKFIRRVMILVFLLFILPPPLWLLSIRLLGMVSSHELWVLAIQGAPLGSIPYVIIFLVSVLLLTRHWLRPVQNFLNGDDASNENREQAQTILHRLPSRLFIAHFLYNMIGGHSTLIGVWLFTGQTPPLYDKLLFVSLSSLLVVLIPVVPLLLVIMSSLSPAILRVGVSRHIKGMSIDRQLAMGVIGLPIMAILTIVLFEYGRIGYLSVHQIELVAFLGFIILIFGTMLSRMVTDNVRRLLNGINKITESKKLSERLPTTSADELGILAVTFNEMIAELQKTTASRDYIEAIVKCMGDGLVVLDMERKVTVTNPAALEIWGYSQEEIIGRGFEELFLESERQNHYEIMEKTIKGFIKDRVFETIALRKDGREVPIRFSGTLINDFTDNQISFIGLFSDITEQKKAEEELAREKIFIESVLKSQQDIVFVLDTGREILRVSEITERLLGYENGELIAKPIDLIFPPERLQEMIDLGPHRSLSGGIVTPTDLILQTKTGEKIPVQFTGSPVRDEKGKIIAGIGVGRDLRKQKQSEAQIIRTSNRLNAIINSATGFYIGTSDANGGITSWNKGAELIMGYREDEVVGKMHISQLYSPKEVKTGNLNEIIKIILEKGKYDGEMEFRKKDGDIFPGNFSGTPLKDESDNLLGILAIVQDITERKQMEMELINASKIAEAANLAKSEFLANMSHEIRTPMNGIIGMTDLTLDTDLSPEQRENLGMVKTSADNLLTLINEILDFSKIETGRMQLEEINFSLRTAVEFSINTLALCANQKGLEIITDIEPVIPDMLSGDPGKLRQILTNLIGNAVKFTKEGKITIRVKVEQETPDSVTLLFSISDTGVGIPRDCQAHIFESFTQADNSTTREYGGSGLGTTISKKLVELMGGKIWLESPSNEDKEIGGPGNTFHFTVNFGLKSDDELFIYRDKTLVNLTGLKVLVLDDHEINRSLFSRLLKNWGLVPDTVSSAKEALKSLARSQKKKVPYKLLLLDYNIPDMDGFSVAEEIKSRGWLEEIEVIMITSVGERGDARRCTELGIAAYLTKPVKQSTLLDTIMEALNRRLKKTGNGEKGDKKREKERLITRHTVKENKGKVKILLTEDNKVNQLLAKKLLVKQGHDVTVAENGKVALEALQKNNFNLVFMDIQMPVMGGIEATQKIREREAGKQNPVDGEDLTMQTFSRIPIIALTAHALKDDRDKCIEAGMDDYLTKPVKSDDIQRMINKWADRGETAGEIQKKKQLLVVDDDENMRKSLVRLLERKVPNIRVTAAEDGIDAIDKLGSFNPDLILTDLMMPRMDGVALTGYIRDRECYNKTGIIVMTGLKEEDPEVTSIREKGVKDIFYRPWNAKSLIQTINYLLKD